MSGGEIVESHQESPVTAVGTTVAACPSCDRCRPCVGTLALPLHAPVRTPSHRGRVPPVSLRGDAGIGGCEIVESSNDRPPRTDGTTLAIASIVGRSFPPVPECALPRNPLAGSPADRGGVPPIGLFGQFGIGCRQIVETGEHGGPRTDRASGGSAGLGPMSNACRPDVATFTSPLDSCIAPSADSGGIPSRSLRRYVGMSRGQVRFPGKHSAARTVRAAIAVDT